jgi:hypothetical protein
MYSGLNPVPKSVDTARDTYYGHSVAGCLDMQDSPYMTNVSG